MLLAIDVGNTLTDFGFFAYDMGDTPTHPLHLLYDDEAQTSTDVSYEDRH